MSLPLVSVIIPAYNRESTIARSVDSVLGQTYSPIELIVVDDGSTDQTADVIRSYGDRVTLIHQVNGGPSSARNAGAARSKGEIISFLDSDDTWKPEKIERQVRLMLQGGEKVSCCICNAALIDEDGTSRYSFDVSGLKCRLSEGYWLNPASIMATRFLLFNQVVAIRRKAFECIGGFNESMRLLEDHDIAFRLSLLGPWGFVSHPLVEKYNDKRGIGVSAMSDPRIHVKAWADLMKGFLNVPFVPETIARHIRRNIKIAGLESHAVELLRRSSASAKWTGHLLMLTLRLEGAIRRRLPSWPKAREMNDLPT